MQELERMINIYHIAFIVFLVLTIVCLAASVVLFFVFHIRDIFDMRTGRGAKKKIQKMKELNDQTGRLRPEVVANTPVHLSPEERVSAPVTEKRTGSSSQQTVPVMPQGSSGTTQRNRTTADSDRNGSQETTLLSDMGSQETTLLSDMGSQETMVLTEQGTKEASSQEEHKTQKNVSRAGEPETTTLTPHQEEDMQNNQKTLPGAFQIEKEILWVHTDEIL